MTRNQTRVAAEVQRTPAPWNADVATFDEKQHIAVVANGGDKIVALCGFADAEDGFESDANAKLIAAAPKLLSSLKKIISLSIFVARGSDYDREHLALAQKIIDEAEGRR